MLGAFNVLSTPQSAAPPLESRCANHIRGKSRAAASEWQWGLTGEEGARKLPVPRRHCKVNSVAGCVVTCGR